MSERVIEWMHTLGSIVPDAHWHVHSPRSDDGVTVIRVARVDAHRASLRSDHIFLFLFLDLASARVRETAPVASHRTSRET